MQLQLRSLYARVRQRLSSSGSAPVRVATLSIQLSTLPPEIIRLILSFLRRDIDDLKSCALISKSFSTESRRLLFSCIRVNKITVNKLLKRLVANPNVVPLITGIRVYISTSKNALYLQRIAAVMSLLHHIEFLAFRPRYKPNWPPPFLDINAFSPLLHSGNIVYLSVEGNFSLASPKTTIFPLTSVQYLDMSACERLTVSSNHNSICGEDPTCNSARVSDTGTSLEAASLRSMAINLALGQDQLDHFIETDFVNLREVHVKTRLFVHHGRHFAFQGSGFITELWPGVEILRIDVLGRMWVHGIEQLPVLFGLPRLRRLTVHLHAGTCAFQIDDPLPFFFDFFDTTAPEAPIHSSGSISLVLHVDAEIPVSAVAMTRARIKAYNTLRRANRRSQLNLEIVLHATSRIGFSDILTICPDFPFENISRFEDSDTDRLCKRN